MTELGTKVEPIKLNQHPLVGELFGENKPKVKYVPKGNIVYEIGSEATHAFLVVNGRLALQTSSSQMNLPLTHSLAGPGDFVGLAVGLTDQFHPTSAFAERDTCVIPIPQDKVQDLIDLNTESGDLIVAQVADLGKQETDHASVIYSGRGYQKAAYALLMYGPFAKRIGTSKGDAWNISKAATQVELAQAAGISRETLNQFALNSLVRKGAIERVSSNPNGKSELLRDIQIVDVALLEELANPARV